MVYFGLGACAHSGSLDVQRAEDMRARDSRMLKNAVKNPSADIRLAAARAMGRIGSSAYAAPLIAGLNDVDSKVVSGAIFALGQLSLEDNAKPAESGTVAALLSLSRDERAGIRLAAVEALGKTGGEGVEAALAQALGEASASVRAEAAVGLFRLRYLKRIPAYSSDSVKVLLRAFSDADEEVRWRAVYAFSRWPEPAVLDALNIALEDANVWVRLFACRSLGQLKRDAPLPPLERRLKDPHAFVRAEAVKSLGLAGQAALLPDEIFSDESVHVRAAAADAVGESGIAADSARLKPLLEESSPLARGAALLSYGKLLKENAASLLEQERTFPHWWVSSRALLAMAESPSAARVLRDALSDKDPRLASAALEALARSTSSFSDAELGAILRDAAAPLEVRGTAVEAAAERKSLALLEPLDAALINARGREYAELRQDIAKALSATSAAHPEHKPARLVSFLPSKIVPSPYLGAAISSGVILETEKGEIVLSLASSEAPIHAANFISNVRRGLYDGGNWHRVVSNFVVQGGDPRGSGWGDAGLSLRDEINRLRFERGALGMPKAGKDTGGCQLFITHIPTPHLDGRYTVFGSVVSGMDVVDRLEPGDKILRARLF